MPTLWENENHDKWKAIFQSDFDSCRLWFKDEVGLGEGTLIFCAVYLAPRVKEYISIEGALSRPTESFPWELWSANEALDTWSSCFSWFWLRALINSVGLFFFFFTLKHSAVHSASLPHAPEHWQSAGAEASHSVSQMEGSEAQRSSLFPTVTK